MKEIISRSFILGDKWIYFKLYTGTKSADRILIDYLKPLIKEFLNEKLIEKWFFIRYTDPDFHIRIRIELSELDNLQNILNSLNKVVRKLLNSNLIYKVQFDTYNRELERYGGNMIIDSENIFFQDSNLILEALSNFENDDSGNLRWLFGLHLINCFLNDFDLTVFEKSKLMDDWKMQFGNEFNADKQLWKNLSLKYNSNKINIEQNISGNFGDNGVNLNNLCRKKSIAIANSILNIKNQKFSDAIIYDLIFSHIHMIMNRLFVSRNRKSEFVCYYLMSSYYKSKIARAKYDKGLRIERNN